MKKVTCIGLILASFTLLQLSVDAQKGTDNDWMLKYAFSQARKASVKKHLQQLNNSGLYDSAIRYAGTAYKNDSLDIDDFEKTVAMANWLRGDKHKAYQYVLRATDYNLSLSAGGSNTYPGIMTDYDFALPIAMDTLLLKVISDRIAANYEPQDFSDTRTGLQLIRLNFKLSQLTEWQKHLQTSGDKASTADNSAYRDGLMEVQEQFRSIISLHNKLLTWREVGAAFQNQYLIVHELNDPGLNEWLHPYFEKAFTAKEIDADKFVEHLVNLAKPRLPESAMVKQYRDSLCKMYACTKSSFTERHTLADGTIIFVAPDTQLLHRDTSTGWK